MIVMRRGWTLVGELLWCCLFVFLLYCCCSAFELRAVACLDTAFKLLLRCILVVLRY